MFETDVISIGGSTICVARNGPVLAPPDSCPGRNRALTRGNNHISEKRGLAGKDCDSVWNFENVVISISASTICVARGGPVLARADFSPGRNRAPTNGKNNVLEK